MQFPDINIVSVILATIAAFVVGFIWFGPKTFFPIWWRALGREGEPGFEGQKMGMVFGLTVVGAFAQAFSLAVIIAWAQASDHDITLASGALIGLCVGVGIAAASSLSHRLFAGQGLVVWAIEVGGDIAALTVMGAIIGALS